MLQRGNATLASTRYIKIVAKPVELPKPQKYSRFVRIRPLQCDQRGFRCAPSVFDFAPLG